MSGAFVWSDDLVAYNFGAGHPMTPLRVHLTHLLAQHLGLLEPERLHTLDPVPATDAELLTVHDQDFIDAVRASQDDLQARPDRGLGDDDTPVFARMHDASAHVAGATLTAARAITDGRVEAAMSMSGGLHHAMPHRASGFCVYNDLGVGIQHFLDQGATSVLYVDLDAHHGDGVERMFWNDPRVVTISVHEHPSTLFPGTGYPQDLGGQDAYGSAVNVALPAGTGDAGWLRAIDAIVRPIVAETKPEVLVTQHGCDSHFRDPLTNLEVTIDAQRLAAIWMRELAADYAGRRWLATGGGGYEVVSVVPRSWSHVLAVVGGEPLDPKTQVPEEWRQTIWDMAEVTAPRTMSDLDGAEPQWSPFDHGYDPADAVDRAILATQRTVFPHLGLDASLW